ncbi:DNA-binding transcriptional regulator, LysR family [Actinokineospora iranica]|uniref:DNA-binding transcriptional regulator, LysR family n=2 Tax=Actinokineospora iranica TaxID=1271860 RepID=A0A1G6U2I9_9PSEU|nr:DNA-binding transcriptional regulator, LysR family [Actinokineospora iranica]
METRRLRHFLAVAEERSFTRAAARLHIVQSGISASVRVLEKELGAPLFERTTQHVDLTPAGAAFLPEARRILHALRAAQQVVDEVRTGLRGTLELGILFGLTPTRVLTALAEFRARHPEVELRLINPGARGSTSHAEALRDGDLDLAVLTSTGAVPGLRLDPLTTETVVLACAPDHPLAAHDTLALTDLPGHDLIDFPRGWGVRNAVDRAFTAAGFPDRATSFEMNDIATILELVRHGLGVACVPESLSRQAPELRYIPFRRHIPRYDIAIGSPLDRPLNPTARAFHTTLLGS